MESRVYLIFGVSIVIAWCVRKIREELIKEVESPHPEDVSTTSKAKGEGEHTYWWNPHAKEFQHMTQCKVCKGEPNDK